MSENRLILCSTVDINFDKQSNGNKFESKDLRGAIANLYPDEKLLHQHDENSVIYNYPLIQYKILDKYMIIGINDGAKLICNLDLIGKSIKLKEEPYKIIKKNVSMQEVHFGISKEPKVYTFLTPWLALNEKNYEKYQKMGDSEKRKELLEKILVGNILSMSKSLDYRVLEPLVVNIKEIEEVQTTLKGNPMLCFVGTFEVNFNIPDLWGIGKSVSRGFGTVKRTNGMS